MKEWRLYFVIIVNFIYVFEDVQYQYILIISSKQTMNNTRNISYYEGR